MRGLVTTSPIKKSCSLRGLPETLPPNFFISDFFRKERKKKNRQYHSTRNVARACRAIKQGAQERTRFASQVRSGELDGTLAASVKRCISNASNIAIHKQKGHNACAWRCQAFASSSQKRCFEGTDDTTFLTSSGSFEQSLAYMLGLAKHKTARRARTLMQQAGKKNKFLLSH